MASPGYLAPPRQSQHGPGESILIEPTAQHQQFYNQARREADKCRLEFHVAQQNNLAIPPRAEAIARSPTSDSHPSPSTGPSHAGDSDSPFSPASTSESARSKPHRGRRRGPLDLETRVKTAFKRRFKLTCDFHRAKRTSCKCFDFSKLEAGYQNSITSETSQRNRAQSRSASQNEISRESLRDIETFSTGGAAPSTPSYPELDSADLLTSLHSPNQVQQRIQPILRFDIYSQDSVNEMMSTPVDPPYIPPLLPTLPQTELYPLPIGRQMSFRNRWTCEFDYGEDTSSLASLEPCPWTGPFEQLCSHFSTTHHSFEPMDEPCWSSCAQCCTIGPGWDTAPACIAAGRCSQDAWQKRFYGATTRRAQGGLRAITVSEPSDNDFSNQELLWGTPGSSNTEPSNFPNSYASSSVSGAFNESHRHDASPHETSEQHCDIDLTQSVTKARISCENYEEDRFIRPYSPASWTSACNARSGLTFCQLLISPTCFLQSLRYLLAVTCFVFLLDTERWRKHSIDLVELVATQAFHIHRYLLLFIAAASLLLCLKKSIWMMVGRSGRGEEFEKSDDSMLMS